ncbi:unnamed protein product [Cyclocybe aegerita]|uniref:Uncharacterized protein n=1 Tax=Cyclocybe aegerita TaxID=1973307 RepID=A0A8S0VXX9_CYCAE|nr:unnamed protein product [Cyclocybe aegerita]
MAEYFDPGFKESLENVNGDISTRWPIFRDEKRPQETIYDVITNQLAEMDGPDDLPYCLDLYSMCLSYIHQHDAEENCEIHRSSIRQALVIHAPAVLKVVWEGFFMMFPFFPDDLDPQMIASAIKFVTKLFDPFDTWDEGAESPGNWLFTLCLCSPVVAILDHCFFFADDHEICQSREIRRFVRDEVNDPMDVHPPEEYYKLLKVGIVHERFDYLLSSNLPSGALSDVLEDLLERVAVPGSHRIWDKALNRAVALLDDCACGREGIEGHLMWEYIYRVHCLIK